MQINVKLMGTLRDRTPVGPFELADGASIAEALEQLGITRQEVQTTMVNGTRAKDMGQALADGDELTVLAPMGGG